MKNFVDKTHLLRSAERKQVAQGHDMDTRFEHDTYLCSHL